MPTPQDIERYLPILFALGALQIVVFVWASIRHRRAHGKPIVFRDVPDAQFIERKASGYSHRTWYTRLGRASRCLIVAVKDNRLVIRPFFPFNLMFLPETYGMEYDIPVSHVTSAERAGRSDVRVKFRDADGTDQDVTLSMRDRDRFLAAIQRA